MRVKAQAPRRASGSPKDGPGRSRPLGSAVRFDVREEMRNGSPTLVATFGEGTSSIAHSIELGELNPFPQLRAPLAVAFAMSAARRRTIPARHGLLQGLRSILEFLRVQGHAFLEPQAIDEDLRLRYVAWLNRSIDGRAALSTSTRITRYRLVVQLVSTGMERDLLGSTTNPFDIDIEPWKGQHQAQVPQTAFLDPAAMTRILRFCAGRADEAIRELSPLLAALDEGELDNPVVAEAHRISSVLLAAAADGRRMDLQDARRSDVRPWVRREAARLVLPSHADLAAFAILMTHYTTFNASTLLGLKVKDVESVRMGSAGFVAMRAFKPRRGQYDEAFFSIDDSPTNPDRLLRFIVRWTDTIRKATGSGLVWLAAGKHVFQVLDEDTSGEQPGRLFELSQWLRRNGLPHANFSSIRKGMRDLAHLAADGDRAAITAMGGQSEQTIDNHYVSPEARRRERARVATAADNFERWITSEGKVDARAFPEAEDRSAATPGFSCIDNRASPMTGAEGRACTAYGMCPICPLALVDLSSPRSCGYLHLLLDRIEASYDASDLMTAAPVLAQWAPVALSLRDKWLPAFSPEVRAIAVTLPLPRLPDVE